MWEWFKGAQVIHALLLTLAAVGAFRFLIRTRFWFPRYVHYLAGFALVLGLSCLVMMPPDAPIRHGEWGGLKEALLIVIFPAIVYFIFVFYGGQRAAYERTHHDEMVQCPYCRSPQAVPSSRCSNCGQTIS